MAAGSAATATASGSSTPGRRLAFSRAASIRGGGLRILGEEDDGLARAIRTARVVPQAPAPTTATRAAALIDPCCGRPSRRARAVDFAADVLPVIFDPRGDRAPRQRAPTRGRGRRA